MKICLRATTRILLVSLMAHGTVAHCADFDPVAFDRLVAEMREDAGVPGMAVAVLREGETLHTKGYGVADPTGNAVTPQTVFQIGSITKSFVALVVLQLAAEGKLDPDDPVVLHIPTFRTRDKSLSDRITIDHLVTHHSGLTTLDGNTTRDTTTLTGPESVVAGLAEVQLFAEPGASFQYSNANYAVLSHLIEVLDERSFEAALEARVFEPLGMTTSGVGDPSAEAGDVATGYRLWFGVALPSQRDAEAEPDRRMIGAGGISASVEDVARYVEAVRARDPRIVPAGADRLFGVKPVGADWGYAYGWYAGSDGEVPVYEHSGFTPGFLTLATMVPEKGHVVVVLTNMSGLAHGDLPRAVTHAALGWPELPAAPSVGARSAIWSAVLAPLGLLLLLYVTGRSLLNPEPMRPLMRGLNIVAALALGAATYALFVGFQAMVGVSFGSGWAFYPDLTATTVAAMVLAMVLAIGRLALGVLASPSCNPRNDQDQ